MRHSAQHDSSGFTLMEVLLTFAILAIVLTLAYATFGGSVDLIEALEQDAEHYHMARVTIRQLTQELISSAPVLAGGIEFRTTGGKCPLVAVFPKDEERRANVSKRPFMGMDVREGNRAADCLAFATYAHGRYRLDAGESDLSLVTYWLDGDTVIHQEETNLFSESAKSLESFPLAVGVSELNFTFFDGTQWVDEWDAEERQALPKAVSVELLFVSPPQDGRTFSTSVTLPLTAE